MLEDLIDLTAFQTNADAPTALSLAFTLLFALALSVLLALTYERTTAAVHRPDHFIQALVLAPLVATTIMLAIGDSVARGLGILGALAIIRFRSNVQDPRNILFLFASLAIGIACGVYGFLIALVGTALFCGTAFLLSLSPFRDTALRGELRFMVTEDGFDRSALEGLLQAHCRQFALRRLRLGRSSQPGPEKECAYLLFLRDTGSADRLHTELSALSGLHNVRLSFEDTPPLI